MDYPTIKARPSSATSPLEGKYSAEKDDFELKDCRAHVIRKADYKSAGNGQLIKTSWSARLKTVITGNTAEARYHRAAYEASQRTSAALFSEEYKGEYEGKSVDLADSTLVKSRFYRQDNLRFNPQLQRPEFGLSEQDRCSVKYARWAHRANGVTELGAAPTGLFLKSTKIALQPNQKDSAFKSQLRVLLALPLAVGFVSAFSRGIFTEAGGFTVKKLADSVRQNVSTVIFSFSAVAAVSAMTSLAFGACSAIVGSRSRLSGVIMDSINFNKDRHLHRIFLLIKDVKDKPDAIDLLTRALQKKIGKAYRVDDQRGTPILLERLLAAINPAHNDTQMKQAIARAIGSYLTEVNPRGTTEGRFLNAETDKSELLTRENHFLALTNLIEHRAIHIGTHKYYRDVRHQIERGVEILRDKTVKNWTEAKERRAQMSPDSNSTVEKRRSKSLRYDSRNILDNPHQYGPLTRGLAQAAEALRSFNHDIVLSLNYQVTRPVAKLAGVITESALKKPNSRVTSFSIGRVFSSCFWATGEGWLLIPWAAGGGIAFSGAGAGTSPLDFPIRLNRNNPNGLGIGVNSTALQMLVVALPAAILTAAAKGACYLEGWEGNVMRKLEPANSKRDPKYWG